MTTSKTFRIALAVLGLVLFASTGAFAQTQGTLVGDVTDPSGAAIPGAAVTVTNQGTGLERFVESNEAGQYRVFPLNPGDYSVKAESAGFKTSIHNDVALQVSDVLEVDFIMELGEVTETIEVTGAAPIMQTQEASVAGVVTETELKRLPVNGRNFTKLILLMPGTSSRKRSQSRGTGESGTQLYSVNGSRPQDNTYTLDGIDANMQMMNSPGISPPMDAIQEFKVATNTGSEFARSAGANVSMVLKSGTNEVHGTMYEYLRNDNLDANGFFGNRNNQTVPFSQNQFGATVGGPMPGLKNKMFWFVSWEAFRSRRGNSTLYSTPPADFRQGDFSRISDTISDPFSGDPFPNNTIPMAQQNQAIPTAIRLMNPSAPNRAGDTNNFASNLSRANDRDQFHWRWDYAIDDNDSVFFRFSNQNADLATPNSNPLFFRDGQFDVFNYGGTWNHIFGASTALQVTFGANQPNNPGLTRTDAVTRADYLDQTGMQMYQREVFGDALVGIGLGAYNAGTGGGSTTGDEVYQLSSNLSFVKGKHNIKVGGQFHRRRFYTDTSNPMNGNASFNGQISGFPMADALLGFPTEIRRGQGNTLTNGIGQFFIAHIQDDWRVNQKLTVNLGMMYQFGSRPYDTTDRLGNLWVRRDDNGDYFGTLLWANTNPQPAPPGGRVPAPLDTFETGLPTNDGGWGRALIGSDKNDFAPRLGISYRLNDKTVIRTGFGIFYNSTFVQELQDLRKFWPFTVQQVFSPNRGATPNFSITDAGPSFSSTAAIGGWPQQPTNRSPYSMQWNFTIQRQIADDITVDIGYVGSASKKQIGYSPFNNAITPGAGDVQPRRLLPSFGDLDGGSNQYNGRYDALQIKVIKRFSKGSQFNLNYTYHKALDGQSSLAEVKVQDPFNRRNDYSRSSWDTRQVFNFAYVYELPFGRGRQFGSGIGGAANAVLGGWSLEGITRLETGPPINIRSGRDIANTGRSRQRPNLVGDPDTGPRTPDAWFNESAFSTPGAFTFGNAGAYITEADGIVSFDVALQKVFSINERHSIEFRTEVFNMPNHVNFGLPQENLNSGNKNKITSQSTNPRQIQLGLRWRF